MPLKIYNSLSQKKETFEPFENGKVRMYVCGITAYDECHLGHARAAVVFDVICRYLRYLKYEVTFIRNFTDVDDKIIKKANETGLSCAEISEKYIRSYKEQMTRLGVLSPTKEPRATGHIEEMIRLVGDLEKRGLAYRSGSDVFFEVRKFNGYGKLSHKKIDELESGARVEIDEKKKDPLDFVLWKGSKPGEPKWPSPWGDGRPGWHLECSAMSMKYLGESFDIHGGGRDLIFPHHENEIAQSEGATGKGPFVRFWIHNGFVNINAEKMSKSLGNIRAIGAILDQWDPETVRYFLISNHYASPLDFTDEAMANAEEALSRFYETLNRLGKSPAGKDHLAFDSDKVLEDGMSDDFNTAVVIGRLFELVREINKRLDVGKGFSAESKEGVLKGMKKIGEVLGVFGSDPADFLERQKKKGLSKAAIGEQEIQSLIAERNKARQAKNWKRADEIREELASKGVSLKDNPDGTTGWEVR